MLHKKGKAILFSWPYIWQMLIKAGFHQTLINKTDENITDFNKKETGLLLE